MRPVIELDDRITAAAARCILQGSSPDDRVILRLDPAVIGGSHRYTENGISQTYDTKAADIEVTEEVWRRVAQIRDAVLSAG